MPATPLTSEKDVNNYKVFIPHEISMKVYRKEISDEYSIL